MGHQQHRIGSQAVDETNQPTSPHNNHGDEEGHCCLNQWESLGASEPQLASQIQKDTFSFVVLIATTPKISAYSVSFTAYLQLLHKPYTDPPILQFAPRAPPFSHA